MISGQMMTSLQSASNRYWFAYKKLRDDPKNFGVKDKEVAGILDLMLDLAEKIEKLGEGKE